MTTTLYILIFVYGAILGSFLNVVILRKGIPALGETDSVKKLPTNITGRSQCPYCAKKLSALELVPIFSFIWQQGKCRSCQEKIEWQYPLVELSTAFIVLAFFVPLPTSVDMVVTSLLYVVVASLLIILFVVDLKTMYLPDFLILLTVIPAIAILILRDANVTDTVIGAAIGAGFLGLLWLITGGKGIGLGDIKLMIPLGALLGISGTIATLLIAFVAGGTIGLVLLASKQAKLNTAVPFGPFLITASLLLLIYPSLGNELGQIFLIY